MHDVQALEQDQVDQQLAGRVEDEAVSRQLSVVSIAACSLGFLRPCSTREAYQSQIDALHTRAARVGLDPTTNTLDIRTKSSLHLQSEVSRRAPPDRIKFLETHETASKIRVARWTLDARARRAINAVMR